MRTQSILFTGALLAAALFTGCGGGAPKDPTFEADQFKSEKAAVTARYVGSQNPKAAAKVAKENKKVFIPVFQVEFINASGASSSSYSMTSSNSSNVRLSYQLTGLDTASLATLVDNLYSDFVNELTASGYEVIPKEVVIATPQYQKLKAAAEPNNPTLVPGRMEGNSTALVFAPSGMSVAYLANFNPGPFDLKTIMKNAKRGSPDGYTLYLTDTLKATPIVVQLVVGFVGFQDTKVKGSGNSGVSSNFRFTIAGAHSKIGFFSEKNIKRDRKNNPQYFDFASTGIAQLSKPVFGSAGWTLGTRDITSTGTKVMEGVANTLSILASAAGGGGGAHTSKSRVYALDVDKEAYLVRARENLGYAQSMLLYGITHDGLTKIK